MGAIAEEIKQDILISCPNIGKGRYAFINYSHMRFNEEGDVSCLHLEARYLDGMFSPTAIAAHACLMYGMMLKAVELSAYGLLKAGDNAYMEEQKTMFSLLCNNKFGEGFGEVRVSDTSKFYPYIPKVQDQVKELINLVRGVLVHDPGAIYALEQLAKRSVAQMRIDGMDWDQIESSLYYGNSKKDQGVEKNIQEILNTSSVCGCADKEEWINTVASIIAEENGEPQDEAIIKNLKQNVSSSLQKMTENGTVWWASSVGSFISA